MNMKMIEAMKEDRKKRDRLYPITVTNSSNTRIVCFMFIANGSTTDIKKKITKKNYI